jgi:hypothetical protein
MGNATNMFILWACICLVTSLIGLQVQAVCLSTTGQTNCSNLFGNMAFSSVDNIVYSQVNVEGNVWTPKLANNVTNNMISNTDSTVGTSFLFPDWIRATYSWISTSFKFLLNTIGGPYTLLMDMGVPFEISALIGTLWSIIGTILVVGFLRGTDN